MGTRFTDSVFSIVHQIQGPRATQNRGSLGKNGTYFLLVEYKTNQDGSLPCTWHGDC